MAEQADVVTIDDLPVTFQVKYLGLRDAGGLWGIKHTRRPVDNMVASAKSLPQGQVLPIVKLVISKEGVQLQSVEKYNNSDVELRNFYSVESISYGVQDLVYTRVFSMIVVREAANVKDNNPFECHAFVCESRSAARRLTYSLAAAFQDYSKRVKEMQAENASETENESAKPAPVKKRFAIDLRTPEEIEADMNAETEA